MKQALLALPLVALTAGCQATNTGGGLSPAGTVAAGAALGAAVNEDDRLEGAAVGAAAGAATAILLDQINNDTCLYRNPNTGATYRAACP